MRARKQRYILRLPSKLLSSDFGRPQGNWPRVWAERRCTPAFWHCCHRSSVFTGTVCPTAGLLRSSERSAQQEHDDSCTELYASSSRRSCSSAINRSLSREMLLKTDGRRVVSSLSPHCRAPAQFLKRRSLQIRQFETLLTEFSQPFSPFLEYHLNDPSYRCPSPLGPHVPGNSWTYRLVLDLAIVLHAGLERFVSI